MLHPNMLGKEMTWEAWIAAVGLMFTLFGTTVSTTAMVLSKINKIKEELDEELTAIRSSAYEEYRTVRKEISEVSNSSRKEFGETISAIREKVVEVELWTRDQLTETRHTFRGSMDMRYSMNEEKIEKLEDRVRQLELFDARHDHISRT